jgi:hypothetical protein
MTTAAWSAAYEWRHPEPMTRRFDLLDGEQACGTVRFTNLLGTRAQLEAFGAGWEIQRTGLIRREVEGRTVGTADDGPTAFSVALAFGGRGELERPDRPPLRWAILPMTGGSAWGWAAGDEILMTFDHLPAESGMLNALLQLQGRATLTDAGRRRDDVPLLLALGWYLLAANQFDLLANPPVP